MTYLFCYRCGGALEEKEDNLRVCKKCRFHLYINPVPCNAVIIENDQEEILLVKRKVDPKKGWWDLPGGFIQPNETIEDSVRREIKEELGVDLTEISYLTSTIDHYLYMGENQKTLGALFKGKIGTSDITPSDDVSEYRYFKKTEIPYEKIAFPSLVMALKKYAQTA